MFVVHGAQAGGFSPISIYGVITNSVMEDAGLPVSEITVFLASLVVNTDHGGDPVRGARRPRADVASASTPTTPDDARRETVHRRRREPSRREARDQRDRSARRPHGVRRRPGAHPGRVRRRRARRAGLRQEHRLRRDHRRGHPRDAVRPRSTRTRSSRSPGRPCCWSPGSAPTPRSSTTAGSPEFVGNWAAGLGAAVDRRADPLLRRRRRLGVRVVDGAAAGHHPDRDPARSPTAASAPSLFVAALAVSSTIVDVSPFSTNGALMLANRPDTISETVYYKQILTYSVIVVARRTAPRLGRAGPRRDGEGHDA